MKKIVTFEKSTLDDLRKYREYFRRQVKLDGHKFQCYEITRIVSAFKNHLKNKLLEMKKYVESIFPREYDYGCDEYMMYVDKQKHYIIFYKVRQKSSGEVEIEVHKCIHSSELRKDLQERGIEPRKGCNQSLLKELESVYEEDDIRDEKEKELEKDSDKEVQTKEGPRGGVYFRTIDPETHHIGVWRSIKEHLQRSLMMKDLGPYIKEEITHLQRSLMMKDLGPYIKEEIAHLRDYIRS